MSSVGLETSDINVTPPLMLLRRVSEDDDSTFGVLIWEEVPFAVTVENAWRDNQPRVSCIPAGEYRALRCSASPDYGYQNSPSYGDTFQVFNVPGRSHVLFHWGNTHRNTEGCIIVASSFGRLHGTPAVLGSRNQAGAGFNRFLDLTRGLNEFALRIVDHTRE